VAVNDSFGESGTPAQLMDKYGLNAAAIVEATLRVRNRSLGAAPKCALMSKPRRGGVLCFS